MALLYVACIVLGVFFLFMSGELADEETPRFLWVVYGALFIGLGILLAGLYAAAFFLPPKPWTWVYHLVLIGFGMTSCCCLPFSIALLVYWLKPETQAWFGRAVSPAPAA